MPNILKRKGKSKMMVVMTFEIESDLYRQVADILARQGLTLSDAIEWLFRETARTGQIPFAFTPEELADAEQHPCIRLVEEHMEE